MENIIALTLEGGLQVARMSLWISEKHSNRRLNGRLKESCSGTIGRVQSSARSFMRSSVTSPYQVQI